MIDWIKVEFDKMAHRKTEIVVWVDIEDGYAELVYFSKKTNSFPPLSPALQKFITHWHPINKPVELIKK